ncbi:hypothetical protein STIAU_6337 [Stigmatella aurantiaca DW4/3-1]|uniref:Uncharacterized protein n=1 Tax=Stigmatella aurantiaca (strain DW4/3-1) TaxID=378806 RepID=Q08W28_STIAD|nr:hypothetical protein STIAU_6337 [Stigmatella aurantiaca DW4/3-1]
MSGLNSFSPGAGSSSKASRRSSPSSISGSGSSSASSGSDSSTSKPSPNSSAKAPRSASSTGGSADTGGAMASGAGASTGNGVEDGACGAPASTASPRGAPALGATEGVHASQRSGSHRRIPRQARGPHDRAQRRKGGLLPGKPTRAARMAVAAPGEIPDAEVRVSKRRMREPSLAVQSVLARDGLVVRFRELVGHPARADERRADDRHARRRSAGEHAAREHAGADGHEAGTRRADVITAHRFLVRGDAIQHRGGTVADHTCPTRCAADEARRVREEGRERRREARAVRHRAQHVSRHGRIDETCRRDGRGNAVERVRPGAEGTQQRRALVGRQRREQLVDARNGLPVHARVENRLGDLPERRGRNAEFRRERRDGRLPLLFRHVRQRADGVGRNLVGGHLRRDGLRTRGVDARELPQVTSQRGLTFLGRHELEPVLVRRALDAFGHAIADVEQV